MFGLAEISMNSTHTQRTYKFENKLTRKDLQGIELRCALVV